MSETKITIQELFNLRNKSIPKSDNSDSNELFDIFNQLKTLLEQGINNLNNFKDNGFEDTEDEELASRLSDLVRQADRIGDKFVKGLGQMYKGVLIKNELSVRDNGRVYQYRCHYWLSCDDVIRKILRNKEEVRSNIGETRSEIIFSIIDKLYPFVDGVMGKSILDISNNMATGEVMIKPINIFDFKTKNNYNLINNDIISSGELMRICKIIFNRGKVRFIDDNKDELSNDTIHKLCLAKFKNVINSLKTDSIKAITEKQSELNLIEQLVDDKLGKYLLVAELGTA